MAVQEEFIVSLDLGTTYSSVSCYKRKTVSNIDVDANGTGSFENNYVHPKDLIEISGYPHSCNEGKNQVAEVPTEMLKDEAQTKYGYAVHAVIAYPTSYAGVRLHRFKLLLDDTEKTLLERRASTRILQRLRLTTEDAITQYLTFLLEHTISQLTRYHGYQPGCPVQLVATVPAIWSTHALTVMTRAVERAAQRTQFGDEQDVFLVSEPDAAATFFCESETNLGLEAGDVFTICDCGGGTVDLITYEVISLYPLRLQEVVAGDGKLCGSSYLNEAFYRDLLQMLSAEKYNFLETMHKEQGGVKRLVEMATVEFERTIKRRLAEDDDRTLIMVNGVPRDEDGTPPSFVSGNREFFANIFQPIIGQILELIQKQITQASNKDFQVKKVILVGGFSSSFYLRDFLSRNLQSCALFIPKTPDASISSGGLLRFLNQMYGPAEIMRTSYGYTQDELYDEDEHEEHRDDQVTSVHDKVDEKDYVKDCIHYFIRKGDVIPAGGKDLPFAKPFQRTISSLEHDLQIRLELYVNDTDNLEDHYPLKHSRNIGCQFQTHLEFEIKSDALKEMKPTHKYATDATTGRRKRYYIIEYTPVIKIQGRNLRCELWWDNHRKTVGMLNADSTTSLEVELGNLII